jgi:hypothetical protein
MDRIGVFDAGDAGAVVGMPGFPKQEGRMAWRLISPRSEAQFVAALLFMRAGPQSRVCKCPVAPPGFTRDPPRLVMASCPTILVNRTGPIGDERDVGRQRKSDPNA